MKQKSGLFEKNQREIAFPLQSGKLKSDNTLDDRLTPFTLAKKIGTASQIFGTVPRLPVPRLPPGGSPGTLKILSTGATLHLGPIRLHVENWECRALKSSSRSQKFGVPYPFF